MNGVAEFFIEIGRLTLLFPEWEDEVEEVYEELEEELSSSSEKELSENWKRDLEELKTELEDTQKFLSSESLVLEGGDDNDLQEELYNHLRFLDQIVYLEIGVKEAKTRYGDRFPFLNTIEKEVVQLSEELYDWFYHRFEPYRLVIFNSLRRERADRIPEDLKHLFPWWDLYANEDEEIFFELALELARASAEGTSAEGTYPVLSSKFNPALTVLRHDPALKKLVEREKETALLLKKSLDKSPHIVLFHRICEVDLDFVVPDEVEEKGYRAVAYKTFERLVQNNKNEALRLALLAGPMPDKDRLSLLSRWVKLMEINTTKDLPTEEEIAEIFRSWLKECQQTAIHYLQTPLTEEEAERLFLEEVEKTLAELEKQKVWEDEKTRTQIMPVVFSYYVLRLLSLQYARITPPVLMGEEEEEEVEVSAYFEVEIPREKGTLALLSTPNLKLLRGKEEEFETLKETLSDFYWFVIKGEKIGEIQEAENPDWVEIDSKELEEVSELVLFISQEKELLKKLIESLQKQDQKAAEDLIAREKIIGIKVVLK